MLGTVLDAQNKQNRQNSMSSRSLHSHGRRDKQTSKIYTMPDGDKQKQSRDEFRAERTAI